VASGGAHHSERSAIVFELIRTRLQQGTKTSSFPDGGAELPERFRGLPIIDGADCGDTARVPSALVTEHEGRAVLDVGACLFSPEEARCTEAGAVRFTRDHRMATSTRAELFTPDGQVELARALEERMRKLLGRSLRLRSVVAGSCNGCEAELVALGNVVFDLGRFGVQFVASPRHADGIVITGVVNRNMLAALEKTWDATPPPRIVIAVGACALSGGPFRGSPEIAGIPPRIPVDLCVPGCPPHPLTIADGLLRLLGRMPAERLAPSPD
jgi:Ni,Fe-hydrogenase III small subunit